MKIKLLVIFIDFFSCFKSKNRKQREGNDFMKLRKINNLFSLVY